MERRNGGTTFTGVERRQNNTEEREVRPSERASVRHAGKQARKTRRKDRKEGHGSLDGGHGRNVELEHGLLPVLALGRAAQLLHLVRDLAVPVSKRERNKHAQQWLNWVHGPLPNSEGGIGADIRWHSTVRGVSAYVILPLLMCARCTDVHTGMASDHQWYSLCRACRYTWGHAEQETC